MGLDQHLIKCNKKLTQQEIEEYDKYNSIIENIESLSSMISNIDKLGENNYVFKYFGDKIVAARKFYKNKKNNYDDFVYNLVLPGTKLFSDFKSIDELIKFYLNETRKAYSEFKGKLEEINSNLDEKDKELMELYKDIDLKEVAYWRKHADLNGYMEKMYSRIVSKEKEFNCEYFVLSKQFIINLIELIKKHLQGMDIFETATGFFWGKTMEGDWEETLEYFEEVLKNTDFEKETILYYCSW